MPQIISEGPVYRTVEPDVVDGSYNNRRFGSRGSLVLFLVLILLLGWMFTNRNFGSIGFGTDGGPSIFGWPANKPTVVVDTGASRPTGPIEVPGITPVGSIDVPITDTREPVPLQAPPAPPAIQYRDSEVIGQAKTTADNVNLRRGPGINYQAALVLSMGWPVLVLRQSHVDNSGEVWIEVSVSTGQGFERGWINQRYLVLTR